MNYICYECKQSDKSFTYDILYKCSEPKCEYYFEFSKDLKIKKPLVQKSILCYLVKLYK